jgi:hypothetical protein
MENCTSATLELLAAYLYAGGRVLAFGPPPVRVDGRLDDRPGDLQEKHGEQWAVFGDADGLVDAVRQRVAPRLSDPEGGPLPPQLCWRRVELPEGELLYFLCNPWPEELRAEVRLERAHVGELLTDSGDLVEVDAEVQDGRAVVDLHLPPLGHVLWLNTDSPPAEAKPRPPHPDTPVELSPGTVERLADNVLFLDYCDLDAEGEQVTDVNTIHADRRNWELQGFPGNQWGKQFKRATIDRYVDPESTFFVTYRFEVDASLPAEVRRSLKMGIERPWLHAITLNGEPLPLETAEPWFDEQMRALPIGEHVCTGGNELTLTARPFNMLCEIMPVYLLGDFGLEPADRGFRVVAAEVPGRGDWTEQGMPFYHDAVRYTFAFDLPEPCGGLCVEPGDWDGSVIAVAVDGKDHGVIYPYDTCLDVAGEFAEGTHELTLDVVGSMRNFMGPHHAEGLPGPWTWSNCPDQMPPGAEYNRWPSGLAGMPKLLRRGG